MSSPGQKAERRHMLMLDDSELALEVQVMMFERRGFEVLGCLDLDEVREAATSFRPEVVLTDAGLGDSTVHEAVALVRELFGEVPVVLFSGREGEQLAALAVELGAQGWASKSAPPDEVIAKVEAVLA